MSQNSPFACPQCNRADTVVRVADLPADGPVQVGKPAPPKMPHTQFGCASISLVLFGAIFVAAAVGTLVGLSDAGASLTTGDVRAGDSAVFSGIIVFMIAFVGFFSILVWRQVRGDVALQQQTAIWQGAQARRNEMQYCSNCGVVFAPNSRTPVPAAQADLLLYDERGSI